MKLQYRAVEALLVMLLMILFAASAQADTFQRLLILPQTITIAGGGTDILRTHCLDQFAHAPPGGMSYGYAPLDFGTATVTVGSGPPLTLQQAIDTKKIRLEGFGTGRYSDENEYDKIKVISLVPGAEVKISVPTPSIIAPDQGYPVGDLRESYSQIVANTNALMAMIDKETKGLTGLDTFKKKRDILSDGQRAIWKFRQDSSAHKLSNDQADRLSSLGMRADQSEFYNEIVKYGLQGANGAFFVMRADTNEGPVHALYTGDGPPAVSAPYGSLGKLYQSLTTAWSTHYAGTRPRISFGGRGTAKDFDTSSLMMAVAAAGGGGAGIDVVQNDAFPEPDEPWQPFALMTEGGKSLMGSPPAPPSAASSAGGGGGGVPSTLAATGPRGPYRYKQKFERGEVTAYARRELTISYMAGAIRSFIRNLGSSSLRGADAMNALHAEVEEDLDGLYDSVSGLKAIEAGGRPGAYLEGTIDGSSGQWRMAVRFENGRVQRAIAEIKP